MSDGYHVSLLTAMPRTIAAVHARLMMRDVPSVFGRYLDQVYTAGRDGSVKLDGQNIFVYHSSLEADAADVAFGVGVRAPFTAVGNVEPTPVPAGQAAATTHVGPYSMLGAAHHAVIAWCREHGHRMTGTRWEVYGHMKPDEVPRTDIYYLLEG